MAYSKNRKYISSTFNALEINQVAQEYKKLSDSKPITGGELENWILHWEELNGAINQVYARTNVAVTVDTTDQKAEALFLKIVSEILPLMESESFKLSQKLLSHSKVNELPGFYDLFLKSLRTDAELFREENLPLKVEERKLVNEFEKISGQQIVEFQGEKLTMQQAAKYLESPDGALRKAAFEARVKTRLADARKLETLYFKMLAVRHQIAVNAGFKNFRDYQFKAWHRFDYTPQDCFEFHETIKKLIVPLVQKLDLVRAKKLGTPRLKPWDTLVNADSSKTILPFKTTEELTGGCRRIFEKIDPEFAGFFNDMIVKKLLDLDSRPGKAPGGYCTQFSEEGVPFIFMNAAGTKRDVDTLLHEGGHSFHYYLAREISLPSYHQTCLEFAEVASMSMELLSRPYLDEFYSKEDLDWVLKDQLEKIVEFFPFMAMIDAFQHWVYTDYDPKKIHTGAELAKKWLDLHSRFRPEVDWAGFENVRDIGWQYPHIFAVPFYYIEYGIAQLGALTVWLESQKDYKSAVAKYKGALSLGATRTLPELFSAVGGRFGMDEETVAPLINQLI